MSDSQQNPSCDPTLGFGQTMDESRREFNYGRSILRWASLLYTAWFFVMPYRRHSLAVWLEFAAFYALFLALYFAALEVVGRRRRIVLALFFLLGFAYFPFNPNAAGAFVYPFVMSAFFIRRLRTLLLILALQTLGLTFEVWITHSSMEIAESVLFFSVVIGLSNFAYSQQGRANALLHQANLEIKQLTQEAERERIARDLHDLLGHTLTLITVKLDLARRLLPQQPDRAREEVVEAEQTARKALAEVREAVVGFRAEGLPSEIALARQTLLSANVYLTTSIAPIEISPEQGTIFCLALREAVTNIVRHARASRCHLELAWTDSLLRFKIEDDGVGGPLREGNGLRGMRERAQAVNGTLELSSREAGGTALILKLPDTRRTPLQFSLSETFIELASFSAHKSPLDSEKAERA